MKELRAAILKLECLLDDTTNVSVPIAMTQIACFIQKDLSDMIEGLKQLEIELENEIATDPTL